MNGKKAYEEIISDKLEQLSMPHLQDVIWSDIEKGLDRDMPVKDGSRGGGTSGGWLRIIRQFGLVLSVIAITLIVIITRRETKVERTVEPPAKRPNISNEAVVSKEDTNKPTEPGKTAFVSTEVIPTKKAKAPSAKNDSLVMQPLTIDPSLPDTSISVSITPTGALPIPVMKDTVPARSKGVKGITSNDYRIVPKKDSL